MRDLAATRLVLCTFAAVLRGAYCQTRIQSYFGRVSNLDYVGPPANSVVQTRTEKTSHKCVLRCVASHWCTSVFYDKSTSQCLLSATWYLTAAELIPVLGLQYWRDKCPVALGYHRDPVSAICIRATYSPGITLDTARTSCLNDKSELINLDSMNKFLALTHFLNTSGLFDRATANLYRVSGRRPSNGGLFDFDLGNGRAFPFGNGSSAWNWKDYQPNNYDFNADGKDDQDCLALYLPVMLLGDFECSARADVNGYICERRLA